MKRFLLLVVVVLSTLTASAQFYVGGSVGLWRDTSIDRTEFEIAPGLGYEFNEKWAVGGEIGYALLSGVYNKFEIAPYARFSYYHNNLVKLFLDMGFGVSANKLKHADCEAGFQIGVQPGLAVMLNKHFSILAKVGFLGYDDEYTDMKSSGFGFFLKGGNLSFGVEYTF